MKRITYCSALTAVVLANLLGCGDDEISGSACELQNESPGPNYGISLPAWNHAGTAISYNRLYDSTGAFSPGIYLVSPDGTPLGNFNVQGSIVRWLPGDTEFVYNTGGVYGGELMVFNISSQASKPTGIMTNTPPFDISRDGKKLYYTRKSIANNAPWTIYEYDFADSTEREIRIGSSPVVSLDGTRIAYGRDSLYVFDLVTSIEISVREFAHPLGWDSTGNNLVISDYGSLKIFNLNGGEKTLCDKSNDAHVFSRENVVAFMKLREDLGNDLYIMNIDGSGAKRLVP